MKYITLFAAIIFLFSCGKSPSSTNTNANLLEADINGIHENFDTSIGVSVYYNNPAFQPYTLFAQGGGYQGQLRLSIGGNLPLPSSPFTDSTFGMDYVNNINQYISSNYKGTTISTAKITYIGVIQGDSTIQGTFSGVVAVLPPYNTTDTIVISNGKFNLKWK